MSYFIRNTNNPEADLERGFSFVGYLLFDSENSAFSHLADASGDAYDEQILRWHHTEDSEFELDMEWYADEKCGFVGRDNVTGKFGIRRSGLCAYAEFDTLEEAKIALEEGDYISAAGGEFAEFAVIFEGVYTHDQEMDGQDEGITFSPKSIAYVKRMS